MRDMLNSFLFLVNWYFGQKKVSHNFSIFSNVSRRAECIASLGIPSTSYYKHNSSANSIIKYSRHYTLQ